MEIYFGGFKEQPADFFMTRSYDDMIAIYYIDEDFKRRWWEEFMQLIKVVVHIETRHINKRFIIHCEASNTLSQVWDRILQLINIDRQHDSMFDYTFKDTFTGEEYDLFARFKEINPKIDQFHVKIEEDWWIKNLVFFFVFFCCNICFYQHFIWLFFEYIAVIFLC